VCTAALHRLGRPARAFAFSGLRCSLLRQQSRLGHFSARTVRSNRISAAADSERRAEADAEILDDPSGFFARFLDGLRAHVAAVGTLRLSCLGHDYGDLKPGDVIDL
jgi:hypothetical protein